MIKVYSNRKIAETTSKGNQEKWFTEGYWYKLDQFGYEALAEVVVSELLKNCTFNNKFSFVKYEMERVNVHKQERTACKSKNFLKKNESIITINKLLSNHIGTKLTNKLSSLPSNKKRLEYIVENTIDVTGLKDFGEYLTLVFEIDALFLNEDRHLNNLAVIYNGKNFKYCPIFDNGAALLSDVRSYPLDIEPKGLLPLVKAQPLSSSFTRQINSMRKVYGKQLEINFNKIHIENILDKTLTFYPLRDRAFIKDRVIYVILKQEKTLKHTIK